MKIIIILLFLFCPAVVFAGVNAPSDLYKGLIAEDAGGNYQVYLAITSVVRNRLNVGMNDGLVALKRKGLDKFVAKECAYAKSKGISLVGLSQKAIRDVFSGKDYVNGATHYEHTGAYPMPAWAKKMKLTRVMYPNTKQEIKFWK